MFLRLRMKWWLTELKGLDLDIRGCLPTEQSLIRSVRQRRSRYNKRKEPMMLSDVHPESILTSRNEQFGLFDSKDENRIIIFATQETLKVCYHNNIHIFMYIQTIHIVIHTVIHIYRICLYLRHRLLTGLVRRALKSFPSCTRFTGTEDGWTFPAVYCLLRSKSAATYTTMLNAVVDGCKGYILRPEIILMDFKKSMMKAAVSVFEGISLQWCFFYFCQSLWRKYMTLDIEKNSPALILFYRKSCALAFVPPHMIEFSFNERSRETRDDFPEMSNFMKYLKETYVGDLYNIPVSTGFLECTQSSNPKSTKNK